MQTTVARMIVVAAAGMQILVRDPDGVVETIDLPAGIVVSQAWIGTDDIAVAWGTDRGAEVDLRTGRMVTSLTRTDGTWSRSAPSSAGSFAVNESRPDIPLGLGLVVDVTTQLPSIEGAGGFVVMSDPSQSCAPRSVTQRFRRASSLRSAHRRHHSRPRPRGCE